MSPISFVSIALALSFIAETAVAQVIVSEEREPRLRLEGLHFEPALVSPRHADDAFQIGGRVALGSILAPWLHVSVSAGGWSADLDRSELGSSASGTISDFAVGADLRWDPIRIWRLRPYLLAGLAGHSVSADVPDDRSLEDALGGFELGADLGFGVRTREAKGLSGTLEARRRIVDDVTNWTILLGLGYRFGEGSDRLVSADAGASRTVVVPRTVAPVAVVPQQGSTGDSRVDVERLERIANAMRQLADENRAIRAELDSMRRARADAPRDMPPREAARETETTPANAPAPETRRTAVSPKAELGEALGRISIVRTNPDAIRETSDGFRLALSGTFAFETNSTRISVGAREALRQVALVMFRDEDVTLEIEGHADAWGDPEANRRISLARAAAVRDELVGLGLPADRLTATGMGSDMPIADNRTAEGRARNRRVELVFEVPK